MLRCVCDHTHAGEDVVGLSRAGEDEEMRDGAEELTRDHGGASERMARA